MNPLEGCFHNEADRRVIRPVLTKIAQQYEQYGQSKSTTWDMTMNVRARPQWLRKAALGDLLRQVDGADVVSMPTIEAPKVVWHSTEEKIKAPKEEFAVEPQGD